MASKIDPVHFFNSMGQSLLTLDHQAAVIDRLVEENAELKRMLGAAIRRLRGYADAADTDTDTEQRILN